MLICESIHNVLLLQVVPLVRLMFGANETRPA